MSRRVRLGLGALAATVVAVALRAGPLHRSPLPYVTDGLAYAGHVRLARAGGHLPLARMPTDDYLFTALLTAASEVAGTPALYLGQPIVAVVGALPVVLVVGVVAGVGRRRGWDRSRATFAALLAGAVLAVAGVVVQHSMKVDEQTAGLFLVPLAAVLVADAARTGDRRRYLALAPILLALPPLHNLDSVVVGLFLLVWLAVALARDPWRRPTRHAALLAGGYWAYLVGYPLAAAALTPSVVVQSARVVDVAPLFLAWILLVALAAAWLQGRSPRWRRAALLAPLGGLALVVAANAVTPVFPRLPSTPPILLLLAAPLGVVAAVAVLAADAAVDDPVGRALLCLVAAVAVLAGLSVTAALTPPYLSTLNRAHAFLHLPVVALAGLGAALLVGRARDTPRRRAAVAAALVVCAAASLPVGFAGLAHSVYEGSTSPAELAAVGFAAERLPGTWTTDGHLANAAGYYTTAGASPGPAYSYLSGAPPPPCPVLSQASWTTTGAQAFPRAPLVLPADRYRELLADRHVVYAGGDADRLHLALPAGGGRNC